MVRFAHIGELRVQSSCPISEREKQYLRTELNTLPICVFNLVFKTEIMEKPHIPVVGTRYLFYDSTTDKMFDAYAKEISPSRKYIKVGNVWYPTWRLDIIEELASDDM